MGGQGSGRRREVSFDVQERYPRLDVRVLRRQGLLAAGELRAGEIRWTLESGQLVTARVEADLRDHTAGSLRLQLGEAAAQRISIEAAPALSGRRYAFRCPRDGRRCEILFLVGGQAGCRQAHGLTYRSQSRRPALERLAALQQAGAPPRRHGPRTANRAALEAKVWRAIAADLRRLRQRRRRLLRTATLTPPSDPPSFTARHKAAARGRRRAGAAAAAAPRACRRR